MNTLEDYAPFRFDGQTYDPAKDQKRLSGQALKVFSLMADGNWRTLREISGILGCPEASISARLRDFRKDRFGAHTVERRRRSGGLHEYRLDVKRAGDFDNRPGPSQTHISAD